MQDARARTLREAIADLLDPASSPLGIESRLTRKPAPTDKSWPDRSLAIDRARDVLGWSPERTYDVGLNELVRMMRDTAPSW